MAGRITVTPEQLRTQARVYVTASQQIEDARANVQRMNGEIAEEWQGQAFQAYQQQFEQLSGEVRKFEQLLEEIHQQVSNYANTVEQRDQEDAQSFGLQ